MVTMSRHVTSIGDCLFAALRIAIGMASGISQDQNDFAEVKSNRVAPKFFEQG